jgi:hypothetical protein
MLVKLNGVIASTQLSSARWSMRFQVSALDAGWFS